MQSLNFTKAAIEALPLPLKGKGWQYHHDKKTPGLCIGIGSTGIRTFILYKRIKGAPERLKLGRYPDMSIEQARNMATELNGQIATGKNPAEMKREKRAEMTLQELFEHYIEKYAAPHNLKTIVDMQTNFAVYLGKLDAAKKKHGRERKKPAGAVDWSKRQISTITYKDVSSLHHQLGTRTGKFIANRIVDLLRAIFNRCKKLDLIDLPNPAEGIERFKEAKRARFLVQDELPRFFSALEQESEQNRDYFLLMLLTGARKSNVLSMNWGNIDFGLGHWSVPGEISKNGLQMVIPLTSVAIKILTRRKLDSVNSRFVFPGSGVTGHITSPKAAWKRIIKRSELQDIRPHDLRRSLGSWMANTGASLVLIGGALGHKDSASTQIYARLATDPIKNAMQIAENSMMVDSNTNLELINPTELKYI